jgi:hypothetical protein
LFGEDEKKNKTDQVVEEITIVVAHTQKCKWDVNTSREKERKEKLSRCPPLIPVSRRHNRERKRRRKKEKRWIFFYNIENEKERIGTEGSVKGGPCVAVCFLPIDTHKVLSLMAPTINHDTEGVFFLFKRLRTTPQFSSSSSSTSYYSPIQGLVHTQLVALSLYLGVLHIKYRQRLFSLSLLWPLQRTKG